MDKTTEEKVKVRWVKLGTEPLTLNVTFQGGPRARVDLTGAVQRNAALAALEDPEVFATAKRGLWDWTVEWTLPDGETLDIGASILKRLAALQKPWTAADLVRFQEDNDLTNPVLATLLGKGLRTVEGYRAAKSPLPREVQMACMAMASDPVFMFAYLPRAKKLGRPRKIA